MLVVDWNAKDVFIFTELMMMAINAIANFPDSQIEKERMMEEVKKMGLKVAKAKSLYEILEPSYN